MQIKFKRINDLRIDNDLKIKEIASIIGVSSDNFFDYASGRSNFPLDKLNNFVNYFETSFDYVTGISNEKKIYSKKISIETLKKNLRKIRKERKLSQAFVAKQIGDKQSTYWNYEKGTSIIPISKLYMLAKFYNTSIDKLLGKKEKVTN